MQRRRNHGANHVRRAVPGQDLLDELRHGARVHLLQSGRDGHDPIFDPESSVWHKIDSQHAECELPVVDPLDVDAVYGSGDLFQVVDYIENEVYVQMDKDTQTNADRRYLFICELASDGTPHYAGTVNPSQTVIIQ